RGKGRKEEKDLLRSSLASFAPWRETNPGALRRCEELAREVGAHELMQGMSGRLEAVRMVTRLLRWLARPVGEGGDLAVLADRFGADPALADWAGGLLSGGEDPPALSAAYRLVEQTVRRRREAFNRSFATVLVEATAQPVLPPGVVPVERFLETVLVPLAET